MVTIDFSNYRLVSVKPWFVNSDSFRPVLAFVDPKFMNKLGSPIYSVHDAWVNMNDAITLLDAECEAYGTTYKMNESLCFVITSAYTNGVVITYEPEYDDSGIAWYKLEMGFDVIE